MGSFFTKSSLHFHSQIFHELSTNFEKISQVFFGFSECFVYVLLSMYFVYIYTLFLLNFDWIIWTNYRRRRHARIPSQSHAKSSKNPRICCKMSIKFIQKSTELNRNPYQNTYLHNKHSYSKCKLWKSKLSCLSPQISLTALIFLWNQCFSLVF